jgi:hypothetical protein
LVHELLQGLNVPSRDTIRHGFNGFTFPIHKETSNVFLGMLSPLFTTHGHDNVSQKGFQLRPESLYLSGFHAQEY